jgi:Xaa-Pro aminopeptidase
MSEQYDYKHRTYDAKDMYGQYAVDWEKRIEMQELVEKRCDRARQKMKEHGLGALVLFRHEWIRYVSGLWPGMHQTGEKLLRYCVLAGDDDPIMFETPGIDLECQKLASRLITDFRPAMIWRAAGPATAAQAKKFAQGIKDVLKEAGVAGEKVGIDMLDFYGFQSLMDEGVQVVDGQTPLQSATKIKFPEEIELMKHACAIQDAAFHVAENAIRPGLREQELKGLIVNELYRLGAERVEQITMASGGRTNPFYRNSSSDKIIRYGDMILIDICYQYMGYNTCYYRNFVCGGKPTKRQKELHKLTYDSLYAAIERLKPGVTTDYVVEPWRQEGYSDAEHGSVSLLQFGHGVGICNHEQPFCTLGYSEQYPDVIQENMVMSFETIAGEPGESEMGRLEEQLVITPDGYEILSLYPFPDYLME